MKTFKKFTKYASRENGEILEAYVKDLLLKQNIIVNDFPTQEIDFSLNGSIPLEVKSCQMYQFSRKRNQIGRWKIRKNNHQLLRNYNGWYAFVLLMGRNVCCIRFVHSYDVDKMLSSEGKGQYIRAYMIYQMIDVDEFVECIEDKKVV